MVISNTTCKQTPSLLKVHRLAPILDLSLFQSEPC